MKVKRYTGSSLEKIRDVIIKELGENAVIVNIKKVDLEPAKKSILGMGAKAKEGFEVTAAADEPLNVDGISTEKLPDPIKDVIDTQKEQYRGIRSSMKIIDEKLADVDEQVSRIATQVKNSSALAGDKGPEILKNVHREWRELLAKNIHAITKGAPPADEDWHEALAGIVKTAGGIMFRRTPASAPDLYLVAGPTGVGKTTTLAKLAAKCVLGENLNVGLISTDTFRVGAVDQLREYASLLGVELAVAFSAEELSAQIERFNDKDVVFIDTPGRSQFDKVGIKSLADSVDAVSGTGLCTILVVPAGIRAEDAETIVSGYGMLKPSAIIVSKTDEASRCDGLTRLLDLTDIPVVYIADGQRVPEDLHIASPGLIASLVMPSVKCGETVKIGDTANV